MKTIYWHKRDLRVDDNFILSKFQVIPLYILDIEYLKKNHCNSYIAFLINNLIELDKDYKKIGTSLLIRVGNYEEILKEIKDYKIISHYDTNFKIFNELNTKFNIKLYKTDGIIRDEYSRKDWHTECKKFFNEDVYKPLKQEAHNLKSDEIPKIDYSKKIPASGRDAAFKRIQEFKVQDYAKNISSPIKAEYGTSRLSHYFCLGIISVREAYKLISKEKNSAFFITRLFWNQHFTQKLQDYADLTEKSVNPIFEENYKKLYKENTKLIDAWKNGKTGFPMVDASMRSLTTTGFINFRMRAMVASFLNYILRQDWKTGADFMFYHLLDADPAINYAQWQMQTGQVGIHPNRIYNPTKQVFDNDPDGIFIKKYLPELKNVPIEYIAEPWKMSKDLQKQVGVIITKDYPKPIIDFEKQLKMARDIYPKLNKEAVKLLHENEKIFKRASLSKRASSRKEVDTKEV